MTLSNLKYRYLSSVIGVITFVSNYKYEYSKLIDTEKLMDKSIDFSSISFGFLLAVLTLLLQNTGPAMQRIIKAGRLKDLINSNKKAVISSAILAFTALIFIGFKLNDSTQFIFDVNLKKISNCIFLSV